MNSRISDKGRLKQKRGEGTGANYKPWIQVSDFSSKGLSTRIKGSKTGRTHHLLSQFETKVFKILDFSIAVMDIREQYPLLPLNETMSIAKTSSLSHPSYGSKPIVMTTDFFVTLQNSNVALTVKYSKDLTSRTVQKFEIERQYWERRGVAWYVVTEKEVPEILCENITLLRDFNSRPKTKISDQIFLSRLRKCHCQIVQPIKDVLKYVAKDVGESYSNIKHLYLYLLSKRKIVFDYSSNRAMDLVNGQYEIH